MFYLYLVIKYTSITVTSLILLYCLFVSVMWVKDYLIYKMEQKRKGKGE